jgi:molybdenum cofactor cytidylyltransferase
MNTLARPGLRIVVLAAGFSARLGQPKALARVHGVSLLQKTIRALAPLAAARIIVIVPPGAGRYRVGLHAHPIDFVVNPQRAKGLSSSVLRGISRARYSAAVLLLPVDLVDLERADMARLIARSRGSRRRVTARRIGYEAATPLILPRWLYARTQALSGDQGLRDFVRGLPRESVSLVEMASADADIDTAQDLERARRRLRPFRSRP